eukprot:SAG22_NODE_740_length_7513_cov_2.826409_2_plen_294_part_00
MTLKARGGGAPAGRGGTDTAPGAPGRLPHVVLVGWAGCRARDLQKYAQLYRSLGYEPVLFMEHCRSCNPADLDRLAKRLVDSVTTHQARTVHVFSNGGAMVWSRALGWARRHGEAGPNPSCSGAAGRGGMNPLNPLGSVERQVLDSAPGWVADLGGGFHFCWEMTNSASPGGRWLGRLLVLLLFPFVAAAVVLLYLLTLQCIPACSRERRARERWATGLAAAGIDEHLLICSRDDKLIAVDSVRAFAAQLRGRVILKEMSRPSEHVKHFRLHAAEYTEALRAFIKLGASASAS